jgi:cold shock CspA family protein
MTGTAHTRHQTATGIITEFDEAGEFGVIDGDDGRMLVFNLRTVPQKQHRRFKVGTKVRFEEHEDPVAPRAVGLQIVRTPRGRTQ